MSATTPAPVPDPLGDTLLRQAGTDLTTGTAAAPVASPALTPARVPREQRLLLVEMWEDNREIVKAITTDVILFLLAIGALFVCYLVLHQLEAGGYPHEKIARLEELHFWSYLGVAGLFATDLLVKLFVFLFLRKRGEK